VNITDIPVPTLITGAAALAWLGSFALRAMNPEFSGGPAADAMMATVVAWWMKTRKENNGGKDDLLIEVVGKNVLPMISGAHAPPAPKPPPYTPPAPKPSPPKPSTPPTKGGLPWGS
jgi:hypothetical protein